MKKLTLVLLVLTLCILGAFSMASCELPTEIAGIEIPDVELPFDVPFLGCKHDYQEEVKKEATCTEDGAKTLTCSKCGEVVEEVIPALGHDFAAKFTIDVKATCSAEGSKSKHCSRCDEKTDVTVLEKEEHVYGITLTVDKEATCTENGQRSTHCEECGAIKEGSIEPIVAGGHVLEYVFTTDREKTCTVDGVESIHCTNCDYKEQERPIPAGHEWGDDYSVDLKPTCTVNGSKSIHCTVCDASKPDTSVAIIAQHTASENAVVVPATIYSTGSISDICAVCGEATFKTLEKSEVTLLSAANKANVTLGSQTGNNWFYKQSIPELETEDNKYYPTETDLGGNSLFLEFSALISEYYFKDANNDAKLRFSIEYGYKTTQLMELRAYKDGFENGAALYVNDGTQTAMIPAKVDGEQTPYYVGEGWHRFGMKVTQSIVVKDEGGNVLALKNGQLADTNATPKTVTYKWTVEMYVDGVLARTGIYEDIALTGGYPGIWDASCLLYTAKFGEDGKTIEYASNKETRVCVYMRYDGGLADACTEKLPISEVSFSIGDDFAVNVVPSGYDVDGGLAAKTFAVSGTTTLFPTIYNYQIVGADEVPVPTLTKEDYIFGGFDSNKKAIYTVDPNHTHKFVKNDAESTPATCQTEGTDVQYCRVCNLKNTVPVAASPDYHKYEKNTAASTAPLCLTDGEDVLDCVYCTDRKTEFVAALGHNPVLSATECKAPDCTTDGETVYRCSRCQNKTSESIPALGHDYENHDASALTKIVSYQTKNEWLYADLILTEGSGNRLQTLGKGDDVTLRTTNNYGGYLGESNNAILKMDLKDYKDQKTFVFTLSLKYKTSGATGFGIKVYDEDGAGYWLFEVSFSDGKLYGLDSAGDVGETSQAIGGSEKFDKVYGDITAVYDVEGKNVDYYLNGTFVGTQHSNDLPTSIVSARFTVGKARKDNQALVDNLCVYVGDANHLALDAVLAANNASGTALVPLTVDHYVYDPAPTCTETGLKHLVCTRCKTATADEVVEALGHNPVKKDSECKAPTCIKDGENVFYCSRCQNKTTEVVLATGTHEYEKHTADTMEQVFGFHTKDEWKKHEGMTINANHEKCEWAVTGGSANSTANNEAALFIAGKNSTGVSKEAAQCAVKLDGTAKYYVVTASYKVQAFFENKTSEVYITLKNGNDSYNIIANSNSGKLWSLNDYELGAATTSSWIDIAVVIDVENNKLSYYVNGSFVVEEEGTVPANITEVDIYVAASQRKGNIYVGNLALYAGEINHVALDAILAANNASGTTLTASAFEGTDYKNNGDGTESLYCIRCGEKGETRDITE